MKTITTSILIASSLAFLQHCSGSSRVAQGNDASAATTKINGLTSASVNISAANGGYVNVGNIQLVIPSGALESDTTITAELGAETTTASGLQALSRGVKFSPEGLQFLTPASLNICYNGVSENLNEETATIYYTDSEGQSVAIAGKVDKSKHCVKGHIEHFSSYIAAAQAQVAGNAAPTIGGANFLPATPLAGIPLRVRTQINDINGGTVPGQVTSAFLYYRTVGDPTYKKVALQPDVTDYTVTNRYFFEIPANEVTLAGIQYYFEATDNLGATRTTGATTRSVPTSANGIRFNITSPLTISAGFARAITLQASATAPAGPWQNISLGTIAATSGNIAQVTPSALQFDAVVAGPVTISATSGIFSTSLSITVVPGLLSYIQITDTNQVNIAGTLNVGTGLSVELDVVGYDSFGNSSVLVPGFSTSGGIGSVLINATGAHFTAGPSATTGILTASVGGLTDTLNILVYVPPAVAATAPVDGASGVQYQGLSVGITFTKPMDTSTVLTNPGFGCWGTVQISADGFNTCVPMVNATPQFFSGNSLAIITPVVILTPNTAYQVRVSAGARDVYGYPLAADYVSPTGFVTRPDTTPPTAGTPINVGTGTIPLALSWGKATDDSTAANLLQYKIVKDNTSAANISTIALADAKSGTDLIQDWTPDISSASIPGLTGPVTYYLAVLVRDASGNRALYSPVSYTPGAWQLLAASPGQRSAHTATTLPDGRILIVGGESQQATLASAIIFDPTGNSGAGSFIPTGMMTTPRRFHTATSLGGGRVLIAGGWAGSGNYLQTTEIFDSTINANAGGFLPGPTMSYGRTNHTATLLNDGRVLIAGGISNISGGLRQAEIFDPLAAGGAGTFTPTGNLGLRRYGAAATCLADGRVLITGGQQDNPTYHASSEYFDPLGDSGVGVFTPGATMASPRAYHMSMLLDDNKVLVVGGADLNGFHNSAEVFDSLGNSNAGQFTLAGASSAPRYFSAMVKLQDGRILVSGGHLNYSQTDIFDPSANGGIGAFTPSVAMNTARYNHTLSLLPDGSVLVVGGQNASTGILATAEIYR